MSEQPEGRMAQSAGAKSWFSYEFCLSCGAVYLAKAEQAPHRAAPPAAHVSVSPRDRFLCRQKEGTTWHGSPAPGTPNLSFLVPPLVDK